MSDKRKFNEIDEQELEQVAGGANGTAIFRCPNCGKQRALPDSNKEIGAEGGYCSDCLAFGGKRVKMIRIS